MAFKEINVTYVKQPNIIATSVIFTDIFTNLSENVENSGIYGGYVHLKNNDRRHMFMIYNNGSATIKVNFWAGDGIQGAQNLREVSVGSQKYTYFCLDSGRFKRITNNKKGMYGYADNEQTIKHNVDDLDEAGKIFITADRTTCNVACFCLP